MSGRRNILSIFLIVAAIFAVIFLIWMSVGRESDEDEIDVLLGAGWRHVPEKEREAVEEQTYEEEQPEEMPDMVSEARQEGAETALPLPPSLHPAWPEEMPNPYNPCANLQVSTAIRERAADFSEQAHAAGREAEALREQYGLPAEVHRGNPDHQSVALTIDVGSGGALGVPEILEVAEHYGIRLTFFLTGCWILENPELAQRIFEEGHGIANHSLTHLNLATASNAQAVREIEETHRIIKEVFGFEPALFRKPHYAGGDRITSLAAEYGMISVQGYPDYGDTQGWRSGTSALDVERLITQKTAPGAIWVLHNLSLADLHAFEDVVRFHLLEGYELLRVEDMLLQ